MSISVRSVRLDDEQSAQQALNVLDAKQLHDDRDPGPVDRARSTRQVVPRLDGQATAFVVLRRRFALELDARLRIE